MATCDSGDLTDLCGDIYDIVNGAITGKGLTPELSRDDFLDEVHRDGEVVDLKPVANASNLEFFKYLCLQVLGVATPELEFDHWKPYIEKWPRDEFRARFLDALGKTLAAKGRKLAIKGEP